MSFYFVRHCTTDWNISMIPISPVDLCLNKIGEMEAIQTGRKLKDIIKNDVIIVSSTLLRAQQTSNIIFNLLNLKKTIVFNSMLIERYHGNYLLLKDKSSRPFDAESYNDFYNRSKKIFEDVVLTSSVMQGSDVVIVSHLGIFECFANILQIEHNGLLRGGISEFIMENDCWYINYH